jgi:hypothetical protein
VTHPVRHFVRAEGNHLVNEHEIFVHMASTRVASKLIDWLVQDEPGVPDGKSSNGISSSASVRRT